MTLIVEKLSYAYGRIAALRGISVRAECGRVVAVIGPNAAGKTTLQRCMIGALRPTGGRVLWDNRDVHGLSPRTLARMIAYVPQRSVVSAAFTVRQVVGLGRYALEPDARRVHDALERMDLASIAERRYRELSVGQQQRVTLARALAQLPERGGLLVLDEPTSAMDLRHAADAFMLLARTARESGALVIMAMHDLTMTAAVADDVWLLRDGGLVAAGLACDVFEPSRLREVFGVEFAWVNDQAGCARLLPAVPVVRPDRLARE